MISTMRKSFPYLRLLLIAGAVYYAYNNRQGISNYLAKNQTVQEWKSSLKWAYDELRPRTDAEKAQAEAFAKRQQEAREEYRKMGIKTGIEYVSREDGKKWEEAKKEWREVKKDLYRGIDD